MRFYHWAVGVAINYYFANGYICDMISGNVGAIVENMVEKFKSRNMLKNNEVHLQIKKYEKKIFKKLKKVLASLFQIKYI